MNIEEEDEFFEIEDKFKITQYLLYTFNAVFFFGASVVFGIGMYVQYDISMNDYMGGVGMKFYWDATAILMFVASVIMLNCFIGSCAAFVLSRKCLLLHALLTSVTFLALLINASYLLAVGMEQPFLRRHIESAVKELIYLYLVNYDAKDTLDTIQEEVGCCGATGASDYTDIYLPIPDTCRDQVTGNQFEDSCGEVFSWYMETRTGWMSGISLIISFLQIFSTITTFYAYKYLTEIKEKSF